MKLPPAEAWIESLGMLAHPEGGWFAETYRSPMTIPREALGPAFPGPRSVATAIYFLLRAGERSRLHRIRSDEMWHFYCGEPLTVAGLSPSGEPWSARLGLDIANEERPQYLVPAGHWFGARAEASAGYSLVGCTVSPGFDYADWELAEAGAIRRAFPSLSAEAEKILTALG